jgi:succinate dehydrogenase / fumarate reductase cytochrome b subunit
MKKILSEARDLATYRGGSGHWSFIFHRITGVGVLLFLLAHIVDTALIGWGPEVYNKVISLYRHPFFRINEIFLFAAVLYHSLNGVRILLVDLIPGMTRHHRKIFWTEMTLFTLIMIPVAIFMVIPIFKHD